MIGCLGLTEENELKTPLRAIEARFNFEFKISKIILQGFFECHILLVKNFDFKLVQITTFQSSSNFVILPHLCVFYEFQPYSVKRNLFLPSF